MSSILGQRGQLVTKCQNIPGFSALRDAGGGSIDDLLQWLSEITGLNISACDSVLYAHTRAQKL